MRFDLENSGMCSNRNIGRGVQNPIRPIVFAGKSTADAWGWYDHDSGFSGMMAWRTWIPNSFEVSGFSGGTSGTGYSGYSAYGPPWTGDVSPPSRFLEMTMANYDMTFAPSCGTALWSWTTTSKSWAGTAKETITNGQTIATATGNASVSTAMELTGWSQPLGAYAWSYCFPKSGFGNITLSIIHNLNIQNPSVFSVTTLTEYEKSGGSGARISGPRPYAIIRS